MLLCQLDHAAEAFRKDPIVCLHHFAVLALWRDERKRVVVIPDMRKKRVIMYKSDFTRKSIYILLDNLFRAVRTAIIYENIFPVGVCLSQDALDTLGQIFTSVIKRRNDTYEGIRAHNPFFSF
jgi:hypothetical protein